MANDPPTSMHMRYGSLEAGEIGITGFHQPRSASSFNLEASEEKALRKIVALSKKHPDLKKRFAEIASENAREKCPHECTLSLMYREIRWKRLLEKWRKMQSPQSN